MENSYQEPDITGEKIEVKRLWSEYYHSLNHGELQFYQKDLHVMNM